MLCPLYTIVWDIYSFKIDIICVLLYIFLFHYEVCDLKNNISHCKLIKIMNKLKSSS